MPNNNLNKKTFQLIINSKQHHYSHLKLNYVPLELHQEQFQQP